MVNQIHDLQVKYEADLALHIELRHLRLIQAIHETGSVAGAADRLHVTQSALSHQIKGIEDQAGVALFVRRSKPLRLSAAGRRMLAAADRVLPEIRALQAEFEGVQDGRAGRLYIATECHACLTWLLPVLEHFSRAWPDVEVDVRLRPGLEAHVLLERETVDMVVASDPGTGPAMRVLPLFDYSPLALVPQDHPLATADYLAPQDFADETLIAYPSSREKLDVFASFLTPAEVEPAQLRQVELTQVIAMQVAAGRGVAVLPDWAARAAAKRGGLVTKQLGTEGGVSRRIHAAMRADEAELPFMAHMVRLARQEAVRLQRQ